MSDAVNRANGARRKSRRRKIVINPVFQARYAVIIFAVVFIFAALMSAVLFGVLHQNARARVLAPGGGSVWENTRIIVFTALAFSALISLAICAWSVIITHRICGPLFVLRKAFETLRGGQLPQYRALRKRDEFKDVHAEFFKACETVKNRHERVIDGLTNAVQTASDAKQGDEQRCRQALDRIAQQLEAMRVEAAQFLGRTESGPGGPDQSDDPTPKKPERSLVSSHS